jgi:hypothetical protein
MRMKNVMQEAKVDEPKFEFSEFFKVIFQRNHALKFANNHDEQAIDKRLTN